jgi:hypothetical protein
MTTMLRRARSGSALRADAFASDHFGSCPGHHREAAAVHQALESLRGEALDRLEPEGRIADLLPGNQARDSHRIDVYQALGQPLRSREGVPRAIELFAAQITIAIEQLPSQMLMSRLLGSTARRCTWEPRTIWSRSVRGVINERVKHTGDCSCVRGRAMLERRETT